MKRILGALGVAAGMMAAPASAQVYVGQIFQVGFGACPSGSRLANGDMLPIQKEKPGSGEDYRDLFAVFGTAYGGDGLTNFALPDMRPQVLAENNIGRGPMSSGKPAAASAPPAMKVELPIVFCVVVHGIKPIL
jgi:microcystin-dependent protein